VYPSSITRSDLQLGLTSHLEPDEHFINNEDIHLWW